MGNAANIKSYTTQEIYVKTQLSEQFLIDIIESSSENFKCEIIKSGNINLLYENISIPNKASQAFEDAIKWIINHININDNIIEIDNTSGCTFLSLTDVQKIINNLGLNITVTNGKIKC